MKQAFSWVFSKPVGSEYWLLPLFITAWDQLYNIVVAQLLYRNSDVSIPTATQDAVLIASWEFPLELIIGATIEELIFRILPLIFLLRYVKNKGVILASVITLSISFALTHGGVDKLLLQGIGGILYSILFIKYYDGGRGLIEASAVVILTHIIFNLLATLISVSAGGTTF